MLQKMMVFNVRKCYDDPKDKDDPSVKKCTDAATLDPFLRKITVEVWGIYEKLFFEKRGTKPVFNTMELISQSIVNPDRLTET